MADPRQDVAGLGGRGLFFFSPFPVFGLWVVLKDGKLAAHDDHEEQEGEHEKEEDVEDEHGRVELVHREAETNNSIGVSKLIFGQAVTIELVLSFYFWEIEMGSK